MNIEKFRHARFEDRTAPISVPGLSAFFDDGQKAEIIVRALTGEEVARARARVEQNRAVDATLRGIVSDRAKEKIEAIRAALGLNDSVPNDLVYRIAVLEFGSASVSFDQSDCVRLAESHPEEFYNMTSKILELTGLGKINPGESNASGTTEE